MSARNAETPLTKATSFRQPAATSPKYLIYRIKSLLRSHAPAADTRSCTKATPPPAGIFWISLQTRRKYNAQKSVSFCAFSLSLRFPNKWLFLLAYLPVLFLHICGLEDIFPPVRRRGSPQSLPRPRPYNEKPICVYHHKLTRTVTVIAAISADIITQSRPGAVNSASKLSENDLIFDARRPVLLHK